MRRVVVTATTGSTNDDARRLAADGAPDGTVVVAERQTAGRGRLGRAWDSPARAGLYLSILLRPEEPLERIGRYAIAAATACGETCRSFSDDRVVLKWPNDVVAERRKLAGILSELRQSPSGIELVVGIGINVNHDPGDFPEALRGTAISLRMLRAGAPVDREEVAAGLMRALAGAIGRIRSGGWREVVDRFLRYAPAAEGRRVRLAAGDEGVTRGLDPSGALRVATASGVVLVHASDSLAVIEE